MKVKAQAFGAISHDVFEIQLCLNSVGLPAATSRGTT